MCVCVCVCVCGERQRQNEKEKERAKRHYGRWGSDKVCLSLFDYWLQQHPGLLRHCYTPFSCGRFSLSLLFTDSCWHPGYLFNHHHYYYYYYYFIIIIIIIIITTTTTIYCYLLLLVTRQATQGLNTPHRPLRQITTRYEGGYIHTNIHTHT